MRITRIFLLLLIVIGIRTGLALPVEISRDAKTEVLPLDQAIAMALCNNLDVRWNRADLQISKDQLRYAWGTFDPVFSLSATRESNRYTENAQQILSTGLSAQKVLGQIYMEDNERYRASLDWKTPLGTDYTIGVRADKLSNILSYNYSYYNFPPFISPEFDSFAGLTITQPLLRDFGPAANMAQVRIARKNKELGRLTWEGKIITAIETVIITYNEMQYGIAAMEIREQAIEEDRRFVKQSQRRMEVGMMSPTDIRQAEVALSTDEELLLEAKNFFMERQFQLKRQVLSSANMDNDAVFLPAGVLSSNPVALDRSALMREALAYRLDYQQALKEAEIQNIKLRYAKNQLWPRLDLIGTYGYNGFGTGYENAFHNGWTTTTPAWSVGVQASIPIGNVQGRSQLAIVKSAKEQAILKIKQMELNATLDVETMLSRIQTNLQTVETCRQTRRLAEETVKIQEKQIEQGLTSVFDAIENRKKLYDARIREANALAELNKSYVLLDVATGTLLQKHSIKVVE